MMASRTSFALAALLLIGTATAAGAQPNIPFAPIEDTTYANWRAIRGSAPF